MKKTGIKFTTIGVIVIGVLLIALVALILTVRSGKISPFAAPGDVRLYLASSSTTHNKGETFTADIMLDTAGKMIEAVDARLIYDPQYLEVQDADGNISGTQITPGSLLPQLSSNTVDTGNGKIFFSVGSNWVGNGFTGTGILATITFKVLQTGSTNVSFNFAPGVGSSSHAWEIVNTTAVDVLTIADGVTYTLQLSTNINVKFTIPARSTADYSSSATKLNIFSAVDGTTLKFQKTDLTTDAAGSAAFPVVGLADDYYNYQIVVNGCLTKTLANIKLDNTAPLTLDFGELIAGDINNDNSIDGGDFTTMKIHWATADELADINKDGDVNGGDFTYLKIYWGKLGN